MRRRFSSLAMLVVGALAARAAYWPTIAGEGDSMCGYGPPSTLADYGLHVPAFVVLVVAVLDLLASFAPAPSALPRAVAGRREPMWIPLASPARALTESPFMIAIRPLGWFATLVPMVIAFFAFGGGGSGCVLAGASYLLLTVLWLLRIGHSAS